MACVAQLGFMTLLLTSFLSNQSSQRELEIWQEFVAMLKSGEVTEQKVRPYPELTSMKDTLSKFLEQLREADFQTPPEVHRVGEHVHYLTPLGDTTFCFTFLIEADKWYFRHLEKISIRLDKLAPLPTSDFPDLPEGTKAWQREEGYWTEQVRLFRFLTEKLGRDAAFDWVRRGIAKGEGYLLAAKTWVPFYPPQEAFILYLCWEQANLVGNQPNTPTKNRVTLEKLNKGESIVRMKLMYFDLYRTTGHLRHQISFEDYKQIFETVWQERAKKAGWKLTIIYEDEECVFYFNRRT
jgi:hypothetical protein